MMKHIETIGNIKAYAEQNASNDYTITLITGSDIIASDVYFTSSPISAVADLLAKKLDIYTADWIRSNIGTMDLTSLSKNTFRAFDKDYFCRIDDTRYFKHYCKDADEFVTDKNGMRIIDR